MTKNRNARIAALILAALLSMFLLPLAAFADGLFGNAEQLREVLVCKSVLLRADEQFVGNSDSPFPIPRSLFPVPSSLVLEDFFLKYNQFAHLLDEVGLDGAGVEDLLVGRALAERLVHDEVRLAGGRAQKGEKFVERLFVEVLGEAEPVAPLLKAADGLLKRLLVGLADGHDLAYGLHLGSDFVLDVAELLEGPAREL